MSAGGHERPGDARAVRVWSVAVRLLHWSLVAAVALAALSLLAVGGLHRPAGYAALAIVVARVAWGLAAPRSDPAGRYARFAQFVRGPRATGRYARAALRGRAPRHVGHNPLGGWMVVALIACIAGLALSGWLYTTDAFFGDERVEQAHLALAWALLALVAVHVGGVVATGRHQHENLVAAMWHGRKRAPAADDIA